MRSSQISYICQVHCCGLPNESKESVYDEKLSGGNVCSLGAFPGTQHPNGCYKGWSFFMLDCSESKIKLYVLLIDVISKTILAQLLLWHP